VSFHEITQRAVQAAVARRVMDRLLAEERSDQVTVEMEF
jgi:formaldehyde-activating enzyme involved in methanogenesis